ncbi:MAG TPA: right-handed parallel beta-helix repeat-containing protein, partial [Sedimentisphaerales bacterium]|nr:right-handed parallel beta-helix repeat-containing protein [Sedimentisphaerales bacterium]
GTAVQMKSGVGIKVYGQLLADGTEAEPIRFTHYGAGTTWERLMFIEAEDSRFAHCIFEYADCEGKHQDYYTPGPRDYHEAVVVLASHIEIEDCTFQNLPDNSGSGQGDALAIISDDPDYPGEASAEIINSQFLSIGQGIHTRFAYVLVEGCFFTDHHGDNDDVDLWGESTPPPLILNNLFLNPADDDMINPTKCSAIFIGNVIIGSKDHCVVLRDVSSPVMINNVISNCANGGIAVENTCQALLVNNTVTNVYNGPGIKIFDLGRAGSPYYLTKGGGVATLINCIVRDCQTSIRVTDSHQLDDEYDAGSHVTVKYSNIEGGLNGVTVVQDGAVLDSTVTWLEGNIDADPQFANVGSGDFHLKSGIGRWNPGIQSWVQDDVNSPSIDTGDPNSDWTAELWPHGKRINLGAYGGTAEASMSSSTIGNIADLNNNDIVNLQDFSLFSGGWRLYEHLLREDLDRNGFVDFKDAALFIDSWLWEE